MGDFNNFVQGAKDLASGIASGINEAYMGTENKNRALSAAAKRLADSIETGAQRNYIIDGFANKDKTKPNVRNIITQTPEAIVLIKKKMFSSLAENYSPEKMDDDELHFIRASKKLFENKCAEITAYEQLTKIDKIIKKQGIINTPMARFIYNVINRIDSEFNDGSILPGSLSTSSSGIGFLELDNYSKYLYENSNEIKRLRQVLTLNGFSQTTNWVKDVNFERKGEAGIGTGVIELTLFKSLSCTTTLTYGQGNASLSIEDPYYLMFISEADIEKAIYQSSNTGFSLVDALATELEIDIEDDRTTLNKIRLERGASILTFQTNIRTRIYNVVTVILDRIGLELTAADGSGLDYTKLDDPNVPEVEKFTGEEKNLANRIYDNTFKLIKSRIKNFENFKSYNKNSNIVRRMMRLNYLGKQIIQPMDVVTIFIDSQKVDDKLLNFEIKSGFEGDLGSNNLGQTLGIFGGFFGKSSSVSNATSDFTSFIGKSNDIINMMDQTFNNYNVNEAEKNAIAGNDFPMWLWTELKPNFTSEHTGTCVFSGLVTSVNENYSGGKYEISVSCEDNIYYFEQSIINSKPGLDQFNGYLYDPLTPFDFEFDEANGLPPSISEFKLLDGNIKLINDGLLRFQDGQYGGQIMTVDKFKNPDFEPVEALTKITGTYENFARRIFDAPEGFTYRWKKGIGSAIINQSGTNDGLIVTQLLTDRIANVITDNPFGGQDVTNVLSILICGEPYNFNTFISSAQELGTINVDSNFDPNSDFFSGIFRKIKRQNKIWGNFVPFKKINTDPKTYAMAMALQLMSFSNSNTIVRKQAERTKLLEKLIQYEGDSFQFDISTYSAPDGTPVIVNTKNRNITFPIIKKIMQLDAEIKLHEEAITKSINSSQISKSLMVIGNNVFFDDVTGLTRKDKDEQLRLKLFEQNEFTKRRLWEVKANRDKNLFIVGSEFDLDYDIQSITKNLTGNWDYMNTTWNSVSEQIKKAIDNIGMELFANSQGHIEFRTPKYNRIPSSVLYSMIKAKQDYGIQFYPSFLEKTFESRVETIFTEIEIIEDQIRLHAIALGAKNNDQDISTLLQGSLNYTENNSFIFATEEDGMMKGIRKAVGLTQSDQDTNSSSNKEETIVSLAPEIPDIEQDKYVKQLTKAANTFNNFDIIKQNKTLKDVYTKYLDNENFFNNQQTAAQNIRNRLSKKMNIPTDSPMIKTIQQLLPNSKNGKLSPVDVFNLQSKLSGLIIQRHEALITAVNLVKNLDSIKKINTPDSDIFTNYNENNFPTFLMDMVENEMEDDFGPNSAKRFVIKESDIISMSYQENPPEFTTVEVSGAEQGGFVGGKGFDIGNNLKLANVSSVDYEMWRMYGFKSNARNIFLPFMNNPELQLAPYALFVLNQQRAKIFTGKITMYGKEEVQPGEVYYVEDRGLLFYSQSVTHDFSYGGSYTTKLDLSYGRPPGEYIPTPLDVIGKSYYKGNYTNIGNFRVSRPGTTSSKGNSLGVVTFPNYTVTGTPSSKVNLTPLQQLTDGDNGDNNIRVINDILAKAGMLLDSTFPQENRGYTGITVRVYYIGEPDLYLWDAAKLVVTRLINRGIPKNKIVGRLPHSDTLVPGEPMFIDLGKGGTRNPSNEALKLAKDNKDTENSGNSETERLQELINVQFSLLYKTIDIWLENDIVPSQEIINSTITNPNINEGDISSSGTNPKNTNKPNKYENMREFYVKFNETFESSVLIEQT